MPGTVLLVDDDPQIAKALRRIFKPEGYDVLIAGSGPEAMTLLEAHPVDVVISDYRMPGMTGTELLHEVAREYPRTARLMLSGEADLEAVIHAMNEGAVERFITKPWSVDAIRSIVRSATENAVRDREQRDPVSGALTRAAFVATVQDDPAACSHILIISITNSASFSFLNSAEMSRLRTEVEGLVRASCARATDIGLLDRGIFVQGIQTSAPGECAEALAALLGQPIQLGSARLVLKFHLGLAPLEPTAPDAEESLRQALISVSSLEQAPSGTWREYSPQLTAKLHFRYTLEQDLFKALRRNEFFYLLQPQHDAQTRRVFGGELLARWQHPIHGLISPLEFIDLAERTGVISEIGEWTLARGIELVRQLQNHHQRISVNISPRQFALQNLDQMVARLLERTLIRPEYLELEITESSVIQNLDQAAATLKALKDLGVRVALDDFGTGYSSLSQLHMLTLDTLKFDRSFVARIADEPASLTLLSHVARLARDLNFETVAEGVETEEQYELCRELGCDLIQGYYFHPPLTADAFAELLAGDYHG